MVLDQNTFETIAERTLEKFMNVIDEVLGDRLEVDFEGGILTIEQESVGHYVINKHAPYRQIWLSSPISGASHYDYDNKTGMWVSTRGEGILSNLLAEELRSTTGVEITLE